MACGSSSSTTRPMIWSWSLYLFCSSTRSGISARHGPHHVAQKFRRVTLLLYSARLTGLPSRVSSLKSGAGSGFRTRRIVGCWANTGAARTQPSNQATKCGFFRPMASLLGKHNDSKKPSAMRKHCAFPLASASRAIAERHFPACHLVLTVLHIFTGIERISPIFPCGESIPFLSKHL